MSDISEHPQFSDLKRLLRKLEKTEAIQDGSLSSLVRQPALAKSPPPLPDVAGPLRTASTKPEPAEGLKSGIAPERPGAADDSSLPPHLGRSPEVRGSGANTHATTWLVLAVLAAGLAGTLVWARWPLGLPDWAHVLKPAQHSPVQLADTAEPPPERNRGGAGVAPPSSPSPTSPPEANVNAAPTPQPRSVEPPPELPSRAEAAPAEPDQVKPAAPSAVPAARVAEGNADAPLLGGRDKYELEARLDAYLEHGQKLLDEGDVTGARSFFSRVADSGDSRGAVAMGLTYDPNYIASIGMRGVQPDLEAASRWYRRAMDLGAKDAMDRLERLGDRPK